MWKIAGRTPLAFCLSLIVLNSVAMVQIDIRPVGTYASDFFDESASELVAHAPNTQRIYLVNANSGNIDVLDINNPANPTFLFQIDTAPCGDGVNSVAVHNSVVAVAVQADPKQAPGTTVFYNQDGEFLSAVTVGALPDMLIFKPNEQYILVANAGHIMRETAAYTVTPKMIETAFVSLAFDLAPQSETILLLQYYPNPFNPETWIPYQLSEADEVTISIYDVMGNVVRSRNLGHQTAGFYQSRTLRIGMAGIT